MFSTSQQVAAQILRIGEILGLVQQFPRMRLAEQRIEWAPELWIKRSEGTSRNSLISRVAKAKVDDPHIPTVHSTRRTGTCGPCARGTAQKIHAVEFVSSEIPKSPAKNNE
jgi:hypothetical protein